MTALAIIGVMLWLINAAMVWFIFGPFLDDKPWRRAAIALFWPVALMLLIVTCFIEAVIDAAKGCAR